MQLCCIQLAQVLLHQSFSRHLGCSSIIQKVIWNRKRMSSTKLHVTYQRKLISLRTNTRHRIINKGASSLRIIDLLDQVTKKNIIPYLVHALISYRKVCFYISWYQMQNLRSVRFWHQGFGNTQQKPRDEVALEVQ